MNKFIKFIAYWLIILIASNYLAAFVAPQKALAYDLGTGDGIIVYGKSGTSIPQYRLWDSSGASWGAENPVTGPTFANTPRFVRVKTSATRNEAIAGILNSTGILYMVYWNGASWSQLGSDIATGITDASVFDIAYEHTTGNAVIVRGGAVDPSYYTWNGTTWSGPTTITEATRTAGTIRWIELAQRITASSNEIALAYADNAGDLNALTWSGAAWTEQTTGAALDLLLENNQAATTMRGFDIQYESLSGELLIAWGTNNATGIKYITRSAAGVWGAVSTQAASEIPSLVDLAAEPWDNRIAFQSVDDTAANSNDGLCAAWDGGAWVNITINCDNSRASQDAGDMTLGDGWVKSGADIRALEFYSDAPDLTLDYYYWVPGTGFTVGSYLPNPNCIGANSDDNSFVVDHNPFNNAEIMIIRQAEVGAICTQKTNYAGATTWNFGNAGDGSSLATPSVSQYQPVGFAYWQAIANITNLTRDKASYGQNETIQVDLTAQNDSLGSITNSTLEYVIFRDTVVADNQPTATEVYILHNCTGSGSWSSGLYTEQTTPFAVNGSGGTNTDQWFCSNSNFPQMADYTLWAKWYKNSATYDTAYTTFYSVPTLGQLLFMVLVGTAVVIAYRKGKLKIKLPKRKKTPVGKTGEAVVSKKEIRK